MPHWTASESSLWKWEASSFSDLKTAAPCFVSAFEPVLLIWHLGHKQSQKVSQNYGAADSLVPDFPDCSWGKRLVSIRRFHCPMAELWRGAVGNLGVLLVSSWLRMALLLSPKGTLAQGEKRLFAQITVLFHHISYISYFPQTLPAFERFRRQRLSTCISATSEIVESTRSRVVSESDLVTAISSNIPWGCIHVLKDSIRKSLLPAFQWLMLSFWLLARPE